MIVVLLNVTGQKIMIMTENNIMTLKLNAKYESKDKPIESLIQMLRCKRPSNSEKIVDFIESYIHPVCKKHKGYMDEHRNYIVKIGKKPNVMWSCHTDTVHNTFGLQKLHIKKNVITVHPNDSSNCLGADCTVGVWLMLEMIKHNVSGLYIFHDSEEIGMQGSKYISKNNVTLLNGIDFAIALDRKGTNSIITHQMGVRCCSESFSSSLAMLLPDGYVSDPTGSYTDTASYMYQIPECTNISVGYYNQHSKDESLNLSHAMLLRESLIKFDSSKLVKDRNPSEIDEFDYYDYKYGFGYNRSFYDYDNGKKYYTGGNNSYHELYNFVKDNPDIVSDMLNDMGYDMDYFRQYYI